jgi:hypothetical protein
VESSMACQRRGCQDVGGAGGAVAGLARFRRELYSCLGRRGDALFELGDAVLTAVPGRALPSLSLEPVFRRGHGMVYQGLAEGRIGEERLRDLLVASRPRGWPLVFAVDVSAYPRPEAGTSPGRAFHHVAGPHGRDAAVAGWAFQWLAQLNFEPDSWTAPQDQVRVPAGKGTAEAAAQIRVHAARLRADGERRVPLYVLDAGYGEAELAWELRAELDGGLAQVLVRVRSDRVLFGDPPPRRPGQRGRPAAHGARFACKKPDTWGPPDQDLAVADDRYGQVRVTCWGGLHPKVKRRYRAFAGLAALPVLKGTVIRIEVTRLPGGKARPDPIWLWHPGPAAPDPDLCRHGYLHRYDLEHTYRFAKHHLGWTSPAVRTPEQASRWTWLVIAALTQLRLARPVAADRKLPWEKPRSTGRLTPGRVRRDFLRLLSLTGTPARPPKNTRAGPGRPKGSKTTPAPRYPVTKKGA